MAEAAVLVRSWRVGPFTVTASFSKSGQMVAEWAPNLPKRLSQKHRRQYRSGRDAALAELSGILGGSIAVVEL